MLRFADCELAVSEPRFPCFKFNAAYRASHAAKLMVQSGWCGFYLAVLIAGQAAARRSVRGGARGRARSASASCSRPVRGAAEAITIGRDRASAPREMR